DDPAARRGHGRGGRVDVGNADRALVTDRRLTLDQLAPLLQRPTGAGRGLDAVKVGRPERGEAPAEHLLIEGPGRGDVVGVDREVRDLIHATTVWRRRVARCR